MAHLLRYNATFTRSQHNQSDQWRALLWPTAGNIAKVKMFKLGRRRYFLGRLHTVGRGSPPLQLERQPRAYHFDQSRHHPVATDPFLRHHASLSMWRHTSFKQNWTFRRRWRYCLQWARVANGARSTFDRFMQIACGIVPAQMRICPGMEWLRSDSLELGKNDASPVVNSFGQQEALCLT